MIKMKNTYAIIMAGGIGSRFWPMSREHRPKQFLDILGTGKTLIQQAFERYSDLVGDENVYIITNESYSDLVLGQLPQISQNQILGEPFGKNTAACVAYAAYKISEFDEDSVLIIAPSDHLILDTKEFNLKIHQAQKFALKNEVLITLGIKPHRPDTGYGYIQFNQEEVDNGVNKVITFTEKPPLEIAEQFLSSGDFLWNSGMFIWRSKVILESLKKHLPEMFLNFAEGIGAYNTNIEAEHIAKIYSHIASTSVDNGILEKADNVYVLPSDFGWSDLGTWKTVHELVEEKDKNTIHNAELYAIESENNLVVTESEKLVVLQGLNDYFVIDTEDALLICKSDQEQEIKKISSAVRKKYKKKFS